MEWWEILLIVLAIVGYPVWKLMLVVLFGIIMTNIMDLINRRRSDDR